jgi:C4-dicarboxylate-binding protein DctP
MGIASLTRFAGTIPAVDIFYVPFMFPDQDIVAKATAPGSPVRQPLDEAMLGTGTRPLWWQAYGGAVILSKDSAIKRPEDMKDKKVRVFGKTLGEFVSAVGGAPALMSGSQQFLAYQRGTVDAGMTGLTAIPSRKLYQVMDHVSVTNHADIEFVVLINEKVWQSLSDEHQEIMTRAARRVEKELRDKIARLEHESLEFARGEMTVVEISEEDLAAWREATSSVVQTYIENAGPLGKQLVEAAGAL